MKLQTINFPTPLTAKFDARKRAKLVSAMARNIEAVYKQATDAEKQDGMVWYSNARGFASTLAQRFNHPLPVVAHTIAALSPNCSWSRNQLDTMTVCLANADGKRPEDVKVCTYNSNKNKAFDILATGDTSLVRGLKTSAFADNIASSCSTAVTVDFHAASIARGIRQTTQNAKPLSARQYELIADAYRQAAGKLEIAPSELQAITWCAWRRLHGVHAMHG